MNSVSPTTGARPLSRRETYGLIAGFAFAWVILSGGMISINSLLPFVRAEFRLSGSETGLLTTLFMLPYTLMQIPGGLLSDRFGAKRVLIVMVLFAGVNLTVSGLWPFGLYVFVLLMMLYRLGCSVYYPTSFSISAGMVPTKERGFVAALLTIGSAIGGAVGIGVAVPLCNLAGGNWRFPFLVYGLFTLALPVLFQFQKWPRQQRSGASFSGLTGVLTDRSVVTLLAINFATNYGSNAVMVWGPSFLGAERGFTAVEAGFYIALVNVIGFPAGVLSGILSDRFGRRSLTMFLFLIAGLSVGALALFGTRPFVLGAVIAYGIFGKWTVDGPLIAMLGDHATVKYPTMANAVFGVANSARMIGGLLSPLVSGVLLDQTGTLASGLLLAAVVLGVAGLLVLVIPRR